MKAGVIVVAAAIATGVSARGPAARRHAHQAFHLERGLLLTTGAAPEPTCGCTTIYTTITGQPSLYFPPAPATTSSSASSSASAPASSSSTPASSSSVTASSNSSSSATGVPSSSFASIAPSTSTSVPVATSTSPLPAPVVPTPLATTCPTPGVYTIPATTVTLTESTTVCGATSTHIPSGTHTAGGVTTVVLTSTTVVCPYATVSTSGGVVTSVISTTTYVCPSAGTYTIAPQTTTCESDTVWVYPTPASYAPGTYTQPEVVTTITETDVVVFCPFTSPAPLAPSSTSAAPAPVKTTETSAAVQSTASASAPSSVKTTETSAAVQSTASASAPSSVKTTETSAAVQSTASASAPSPAESSSTEAASSSTPTTSPGSGGGLGSSGNQWAITYSPYENNGQCKDAPSVAADIAIIAAKGFKSIRVYSTDCSGLQNIGAACKLTGLKMIIGIFISDTGCSGAQEQVTDIVAWGQWDLVELVVIGNEAVFSGYATGSELASFISSCKSTFSSAGYSGPCTTTEPLNVWQENTGALCDVVDVVGCNIHPFFNADVTASDAGPFTSSQLDIVDTLCSGKTGINLETGWPSFGTCNGVACPGTSEQATAVKSIQDTVGGKSVMFSYSDDMWKEPGSFGCEQSWGLINLFG